MRAGSCGIAGGAAPVSVVGERADGKLTPSIVCDALDAVGQLGSCDIASGAQPVCDPLALFAAPVLMVGERAAGKLTPSTACDALDAVEQQERA